MFLCKWRARKQISLHRDNIVALYCIVLFVLLLPLLLVGVVCGWLLLLVMVVVCFVADTVDCFWFGWLVVFVILVFCFVDVLCCVFVCFFKYKKAFTVCYWQWYAHKQSRNKLEETIQLDFLFFHCFIALHHRTVVFYNN